MLILEQVISSTVVTTKF